MCSQCCATVFESSVCVLCVCITQWKSSTSTATVEDIIQAVIEIVFINKKSSIQLFEYILAIFKQNIKQGHMFIDWQNIVTRLSRQT